MIKFNKMKKFIQILLFVLASNTCIGQTKSELIQQNQQLKMEIQEIKDQLSSANNRALILETKLKAIESILLSDSGSIRSFKSHYVTTVSTTDSIETSNTNNEQKRCQAITAKGSQCSRNVSNGSKYCWQHQTYNESTTSTKTSSSSDKNNSSKSSSRTIYTGPRGGKYYINSNGNKTYIRH
jgi:colicin import membrane protein